jgi:hypothetical protein
MEHNILVRLLDFQKETDLWIERIRRRFSDINKDDALVPEDKKRLKEFYLETCVTPRIREALKKYFPEEFAGQRPGNKR